MKKIIRKTYLASAIIAATSASVASPLVDKAWLGQQLPQEITAYARIPNPLFLFTETDTPLKALQGKEDYIKQVQAIKKGALGKFEQAKLSKKQRQALNWLLQHVKAPVEMAVPGEVSLRKQPTLLLATKLDYESTEALEKDLMALELLQRRGIEMVPANGDTGILKSKYAKKAFATYYYAPETGKLLIAATPTTAEAQAFAKLLTEAPQQSSAIARAEALIDESGQGLLAVLKPTPELFKSLPIFGEVRKSVDYTKINEAKEIALGFGVANQQAKIKLYVDMPRVGIRQVIPAYEAPKNVAYYGQLSSAFTLSLPNDEAVEKLLPLLDISPKTYADFQKKVQDKYHISWQSVQDLLARSVRFVTDDNGSYLVTDADVSDKIAELVNQLNANNIPVSLTEKTVGDKTLYHLNLNDALKQMDRSKVNLLALINENHYYWIKEGDALIMSTIPQPLLARDGSAKTLLADAYPVAKGEVPETFFSALVNTRNLSQKAYYRNLSTLHKLSDFANVPFDITAYPTANELNFARYGAMGLRINNGGDLLSVELTTTNGLSDAFEGGSVTNVALAGILSAIALPAYQQYVQRAQLVSVYHSAQPLKFAIESKANKGLKALDSKAFAQELKAIRLGNGDIVQSAKVNEGKIQLMLKIARRGGKTMVLSPVVTDGRVTDWKCEVSGVSYRVKPRGCR